MSEDAGRRAEDWGNELGEAAASRFVSWDAKLWREFIDGPGTRYARELDGSSWPHEQIRTVFRNYLELGAEAVGLGYIYPADAVGRPNLFTHLWLEVLPEQLPELDPGRQVELLAASWNLAENLERGPAWLERVFLESLDSLDSISDLESYVATVEEEVLESPAEPLDADAFDVHWVHLGSADSRFLPGAIRFVAPTVVAVDDRHTDVEGDPRATIGVWLRNPPLILGPLKTDAADDSSPALGDDELWAQVKREDSRCTPRVSGVRNSWRAAFALRTSQFLVTLAPTG